MRVASYSQTCNSLRAVLDTLVEGHDVTTINRRDGANAAYLAEAIAQTKSGQARPHTLVAA
jgi:PHD/YefM family antitoxin component YafN of YafNO toxin-antitoxin module